MNLTDEDREELAAAKRRSPNSHWISVAAEAIVARHVEAALSAAADHIDECFDTATAAAPYELFPTDLT